MTTSSGQPDPLIGRRFGSFVVSRKLGEGGMGAVYELVHPSIGKRQALKVLHSEYAKKQSIVDRFFAEAKSVVTIGHPNIVDITDFATLEDGTAYIVMEFLEGQSLAGYVKQRGPMSPAEMAAIVIPICDALAAAHAHGIVHRDLKPENVHLVPRPDNPRYVKVLDFGIAKLAGAEGASGAMTKTGQVMGTPTYMSPEQAMGRTREVDHRTDIYALGVMMYQLLAGEVPFQADSFGDLMLMHLQSPPPPLATRRPDLPPIWDQIIQRALAKNRDERFGSMQEIQAAIRGALGAGASGSYPVQAGPPMGPTIAMPYGGGSQPPSPSYASRPPGSQPPTPSYPSQAPTPSYGSQAPTPSYGSQPPTPSQPSWPPPSGESTPGPGAAPSTRKSPALLIALGLVGLGAVVAVVMIVSGGGSKSTGAGSAGSGTGTAIAAATLDAGSAAVTPPPPPPPATPPDAAPIAVAATPDAAPIAEVAPPDAAPAVAIVPGGKNDHHHHTGPGHAPPPGTVDPPLHPGTPPGPGSAAPAGTAKLRITAVPWGNVFVDGKAHGQTPQIVDVPAGKAVRVRVVNPELNADQTQTVIGDADATKSVRFNFGGGD